MSEGLGSDNAPYHRIRSISFKGGFLDGAEFVFDDSLNCIIGGRGTGKTTVLEALRYVLDRLPDPNHDKDRYRSIERLIDANFAGGSARVEVETAAGTIYTVTRGAGEAPLVSNESGRPVEINIVKDIHFGVDVYSQNQIEDIANDPFFQLELIDKFIRVEVDDLEREIRETTKELETNASRILQARRDIDDLVEATRELPDVAEKIRAYEQASEGSADDPIRKEHAQKSLRTRELQLTSDVKRMYAAGLEAVQAAGQHLVRQFEDAFATDFEASPNLEVIRTIRDAAQTAVEDVEKHLQEASRVLKKAQTDLATAEGKLHERHAVQEKQYRDLVDEYEQERAKGLERNRLEQRHAELKENEGKLNTRREALSKLELERDALRARLSDMRDRRFKLREETATRLNQRLSPMIRIRVEQFGNTGDYGALLSQAMKGSGMRYASIVERAVERIPPAELASLVQRDDRTTLARELDLDADRATRVIIQLKDKPEIFDIETVELHDRPVLELKDGQDYKDASSLSTGQKCTTILPILLMESERPLLIDQPEDNLDNAFVFETIVQGIREVQGRRQLIFVTHNPNIPVLGDAARVFALQSTGRAARVANAGTVDDVAREIMTILEGGRAAFEARRKRYGKPLPEDTKKT